MPTDEQPTARLGRRPGDADTRQEILDAALKLFADQGFEATSMRAIAREARVDPALIRHYFGDKGTLFAESIASRTQLGTALATLDSDSVSADSPGTAIAAAYLAAWDNPLLRPALTAAMKAGISSPQAGEKMMASVLKFAKSAIGDHTIPTAHIMAAGTQLLGIVLARYVIKVPALAEPPSDDIARLIGPALDRTLTPQHKPDQEG